MLSIIADHQKQYRYTELWAYQLNSSNIMNNIRSHGYENIIALCPHCGQENIYNRASDLGGKSLASRIDVQCSNSHCGKIFPILGDLVNPSYEILILDCYKLIQEKRYTYSILNLAQSFEMFFAIFLRVELLYKPFHRSKSFDYATLNRVAKILSDKTKDLTFDKMRSVFLNYLILRYVLMKQKVASLEEAEVVISQINQNKPPKNNLALIANAKLEKLLIRLYDFKIGEKRNQVVHKAGYLPSLNEVNSLMKETQEIIYGLQSELGNINDIIDIYTHERRKSR